MKRTVTALAALYFVAMGIGITFPGIIPFNRIRPLIFGIPFVFAWVLVWVAGSLIVFYALYRVYER